MRSLIRITFLFGIAVLLSFQSQAQCDTTVEWELIPLPENPDSDTLNICVDVHEYFTGSNWLHGVSLLLPEGWDFIDATSDEDCGDGEWVFVENPRYPSLGPGYYYDASTGGPLDGNPFNNFGASTCSNVAFCFQVRTPQLSAEELNELDGNPIGPAIAVIGDSWLLTGWPGAICSLDDVTHYLDMDISTVFNGQELIGEFEINPSYCTPETVELQLFNPGTYEMVETQTVSVNEDGTYSAYIDSYGQYDVLVLGQGLLSQKIDNVELLGGVNTIAPVSIIPGDVNGDNQINIVDVSSLSSGFGLQEGDIYFNPSFDFNCDGYVNVVDVSVLSAGFGLVGE